MDDNTEKFSRNNQESPPISVEPFCTFYQFITYSNHTLWLLVGTLHLLLLEHQTTGQNNTSFEIGGYVETFYAYDFTNPTNALRQPFLFNHNRHNEVNLNFGVIKLSVENQRSRANLSLMAGTYANDNLAAEPGVLKNIYEANVGIKLLPDKELWIDVGIMESHIGFESAFGNQCLQLTRSIMAENSPYFSSGINLNYTSSSEKWYFSLHLLNGWQRIQRVQGNSLLSTGHQITWFPTERITVNSSSFIGTDDPDTNRRMRYFHNFFIEYDWTEQIDIIAGYDIGFQQISPGSKSYNRWESFNINTRIAISERWHLGLRTEFYADPDLVIIETRHGDTFNIWGGSVNLDVKITDNAMWRIEARGLNNSTPIFGDASDTFNFFMTSALAFEF